MPAGDLFGPYQLLARADNRPKRRSNKPERDEQGHQRVEIGAAHDRDEKAGHYRRKRYKNIADVVKVGEAYRRVVTARATEQTHYAPVVACSRKAHYDWNESQDRSGMKKPVNRLPDQQTAHPNHPDPPQAVPPPHTLSPHPFPPNKLQNT